MHLYIQSNAIQAVNVFTPSPGIVVPSCSMWSRSWVGLVPGTAEFERVSKGTVVGVWSCRLPQYPGGRPVVGDRPAKPHPPPYGHQHVLSLLGSWGRLGWQGLELGQGLGLGPGLGL